MVNVPGPPSSSDEPDEFTSTAPDYASDGHADNRILHINTKWFRYGTSDPAHAASLVLSFVILLVAIALSLIGACSIFTGHDPKWLEILVTWVGNAFLFTAGIAVGKGGGETKKLK